MDEKKLDKAMELFSLLLTGEEVSKNIMWSFMRLILQTPRWRICWICFLKKQI